MACSKMYLAWLLTFAALICGRTHATDVSVVTWAHGLNTRLALERALQGDATFLVASVSFGIVIDSQQKTKEPVIGGLLTLAYMSLEDWIDVVIYSGRHKGVKLVFKDSTSVLPAFLILSRRINQMNFPLWIQADILQGPVDADYLPITPDWFLNQATHNLPQSTLSLGWVTSYDSASHRYESYEGYTWRSVMEMVELLNCQNIKQPISFYVRAVFVRNSLAQFLFLLQVVPRSTLTVWSSELDVVFVNDLLKLRSVIPSERIYYDLMPVYLAEEFERKKNQAVYKGPNIIFNDNNWILYSQQKRTANANCCCGSYVTSNSIVMNHDGQSVVLLTDRFVLPLNVSAVFAPFELYNPNNYNPYVENRVSIFVTESYRVPRSRNDITPELVWNVTRSARKMTFRSWGYLGYSSCNVSFVYDVGKSCSICSSCPEVYGTQMDTACELTPALMSNEVVVGFLFEGWRGAAVHDIDVIGQKSGSTSGHPVKELLWSFVFGLWVAWKGTQLL